MNKNEIRRPSTTPIKNPSTTPTEGLRSEMKSFEDLRGMTVCWTQVGRQMNSPFRHLNSILF